MRKLIDTFPQQLEDSLNNGTLTGKISMSEPIHSLIICGMGGSGIGGKIVLEWLSDTLEIPCVAHNSYGLPNFANKQTLVIISSYSGNTEETLSSMEVAMAKQCRIGCITSGGKVRDWAKRWHSPYLEVNGGQPPRSQFGQSVVQLCRMLESFGLIGPSIYSDLHAAAKMLMDEANSIQSTASNIASDINATTPIIYSSSAYEGSAIRWRQQIGENAKMLCWHHQFPEMNHNDLVGWESGNEKFSVVLLRNEDDAQRVKVRMDISKEIFKEKGAKVVEVKSKGLTKLERSLYLVHLGDWVSLILAEMNETDPVDIKNIILLKDKLAKIQ
ncbi:MAG: bifunctional phosphoglucose/phosphomannose isomerase [Flavobacteriales bacterium]